MYKQFIQLTIGPLVSTFVEVEKYLSSPGAYSHL